jgi:hypothetical protein
MNSLPFDDLQATQWLLDRKWTPELSQQWQEYYHNAPRISYYNRGGQYLDEELGILPKYKDLEPVKCGKQIIQNNSTSIPNSSTGISNSSTGIRNNSIIIHQNSFIIFFFFIILIIVR